MVRTLAIALILLLLPVPAGAGTTDVQRLERSLREHMGRDPSGGGFAFRVRCPDDTRVDRKGRIAVCKAVPRDRPDLDSAIVVALILDGRHGYAFDFGTGIPRSAREIRQTHGRNRSCRYLERHREVYFYAVMYWFAERMPPRMDGDHDGTPCEASYAASDVAEVWGRPLRF